jgi:hypothetical protein
MRALKLSMMVVATLLIAYNLKAQDITFEPHNTFLYGDPGTEIIFDIDVTNITTQDQTVFLVRTINNLPAGWSSSLCFDLCFANFIDSIATTSDFGSSPLTPGETRVVSLHVFTDNTVGTAEVQIQAGTFRHPDDRITVNFMATTDPTISVRENLFVNKYYLFQNYPNPFNPSTRIDYNVGKPGLVQLKVYNILGVEVATLVDEYKNAGNYSFDFSADNYSSGVYFYSLSVNDFTQTRKMILEK